MNHETSQIYAFFPLREKLLSGFSQPRHWVHRVEEAICLQMIQIHCEISAFKFHADIILTPYEGEDGGQTMEPMRK
jgi:hypothetical protein